MATDNGNNGNLSRLLKTPLPFPFLRGKHLLFHPCAMHNVFPGLYPLWTPTSLIRELPTVVHLCCIVMQPNCAVQCNERNDNAQMWGREYGGGALGHSLGVTDWSKGKWDGGWKQLLSGVQIELGRGYWTGPCRGGKGDTGVRSAEEEGVHTVCPNCVEGVHTGLLNGGSLAGAGKGVDSTLWRLATITLS